MKSEYVLTYFKGCPNAQLARNLLAQAGVMYREVCQDDLAPDDPHRQYSSPSLLNGAKLVFGSEATGADGSCSLDIPTLEELQRLIATDRD